MDHFRDRAIGWWRPLVAVVVATMVGIGALAMLGTHVSHILSTVGASVSSDGVGYLGPQVGQGTDSGSGGDTGGDPGDDSGQSGGGAPVSAQMLDAVRPDLLVVKTGEISIQAAAIGPAVEAITQKLVALGGYASGSTRSGTGDGASASITFRVPANRWEAALAAARGAGDLVLDERTETVDVTGDVVDLRARIRNLRATEAAVEAIMTRADTIKDVLEVQARLGEVRGEIEQLSARAADLEERAAYSTLTVNVATKPASVVVRPKPRFDPGHEADEATAKLVRILEKVATAGIWFGIVWLPVLVGLAIAAGVGFFLVRRVLRGLGGGSDGPIAPVAEGGA